jgi:hypothetical protein
MVLIVNQENQESQESKKKLRLPVEMKSQETKDLHVNKDLVVAKITKHPLTESRKESQDPLVSQKPHVKDRKVVKLKDTTDLPASQDNHAVAKKAKMRVTLDPPVNQDNPAVARRAKMKVTQDPHVSQDNPAVARIIKVTQHTLNLKDLQESTKMNKSEAMIEVPTDVPEDPVVRVAGVAVVKVVRDPMVNSVAEEETATAVVDLAPKVIAQGLSTATTAKKKDTSPETAPPPKPLPSEMVDDSVYQPTSTKY